MPSPPEDGPEFRRLLAGEAVGMGGLARVALEIAVDAYPGLDTARYVAQIATLADRVRERCRPSQHPAKALAQINWALYTEETFRGNREDYGDPRNSYLNDVCDRRLGLPITLCILLGAVAEALGLAASGVNAPAHFLLRVETPAAPLFVDAFDEGKLLDREGCNRLLSEVAGRPVALDNDQLAPAPPRLVIARLLRNLKGAHLRAGDFPALLPVQRRLAALDPDGPVERLDLGMLYLRLDRPGDAIAPLEAYLAARLGSPQAEEVAALVRKARRDVAWRN